jgi:hypothetical protein
VLSWWCLFGDHKAVTGLIRDLQKSKNPQLKSHPTSAAGTQQPSAAAPHTAHRAALKPRASSARNIRTADFSSRSTMASLNRQSPSQPGSITTSPPSVGAALCRHCSL